LRIAKCASRAAGCALTWWQVASRDAQHRSERCAERDELTAMMNSMESELSGSLDKSLKKIVELQAEIAHLRHQQSLSDK
jgi:hypothetical protein